MNTKQKSIILLMALILFVAASLSAQDNTDAAEPLTCGEYTARVEEVGRTLNSELQSLIELLTSNEGNVVEAGASAYLIALEAQMEFFALTDNQIPDCVTTLHPLVLDHLATYPDLIGIVVMINVDPTLRSTYPNLLQQTNNRVAVTSTAFNEELQAVIAELIADD